MASRIKMFSAVCVTGLVAMTGIASAGSLPGFKQIGCWNKVVVGCESIGDLETRAVCQYKGFSTCNASHAEDHNVSLESIREALPSVTATRVIIRQSASEVPAAHVETQ